MGRLLYELYRDLGVRRISNIAWRILRQGSAGVLVGNYRGCKEKILVVGEIILRRNWSSSSKNYKLAAWKFLFRFCREVLDVPCTYHNTRKPHKPRQAKNIVPIKLYCLADKW